MIWLADGRFPSQRALRVPGGIVKVPQGIHEAFEASARGRISTHLPSNLEPQSSDGGGKSGKSRSSFPAKKKSAVFLCRGHPREAGAVLVFPVMARDRGGMDVLMEPSRFVRELPGDVYEKWVINARRRARSPRSPSASSGSWWSSW